MFQSTVRKALGLGECLSWKYFLPLKSWTALHRKLNAYQHTVRENSIVLFRIIIYLKA